MSDVGVRWADVEASCPELAAAVWSRFAAHPHHVLATVDGSGAPRVSGSNVMVDDGELWVGSMPGARKAVDLRRNPRCALHAAPIDEKLTDGDAKITATADPLPLEECRTWLEQRGHGAAADGEVFLLRVTRISLVQVDGEQLHIRWWTPADGPRETRRS